MYLDAALTPASLAQVPELARAAEAAGLDAVWTTEIQHNPFLPLPLVAEHTTRLRFGTGVAIGFARSPLTLAQASWDLAQQSGGRAYDLTTVHNLPDDLRLDAMSERLIRNYALWTTPLWFGAVVVLMLGEWASRKMIRLI